MQMKFSNKVEIFTMIKQEIMNINKYISEQLKDKNDALYVNGNEVCRGATKKLKKCNREDAKDYFRSTAFSLPLKTGYGSSVSKFSVLLGLYQVLIIPLICMSETAPAGSGSNGSQSTQEGEANGYGSFIVTIKGYLQSGINCISNSSSENSGCVQKIFLFLSLAGTFLSLIGAMFSLLYRFCSCFMCCRRSPRPKATNQANNNNKQMELMQMQMQMQQQQMCNALMGAALAKGGAVKNGNKKGDMNKGDKKGEKHKRNKKDGNDRKKKKSPSGKKKPRGKNSKDKRLHIGYQKFNE
ncbi:hypothetical protein POVWA2_023860 [Plasmodium ovale wallikeri]|uniref:PIR Superfamily Protein n=1 Tax=Plasmodium ovale wallikeri TaxID=864142 RepID=A0A1A8YTD6_PLAOA|nr:hypothetical protein POVWA1_023970 [Plasmodium ovale wallikeri]SBT35208.1 hypothetical protein POVWA2_023860 [Plasmodium ovale wallikeri]